MSLTPIGRLSKAAQGLAYSLWTYVIVGLLLLYVIFYLFLELPFALNELPTVNPLRTLLGGLATGLITAQALVFTISLVAAQLNARYTHRMVSRVFTWPTALYMGLFIASSIYSAVILAILSNRPVHFAFTIPGMKPIHPVTVALALAGTCLVLLVPYLWSFRKRMDPERMAEDEGRRARIRLRRGPEKEPPEVASLDNIVMSAYGYRDYDTFARGLNELSDVALQAWRLSQTPLGESIFRRIAHVGVATIDDPRAPFQVVDALGGVGIALSEGGLHEGARQAAVAMSEIGEMAVEKGQAAVIRQIALSLSALGAQAVERGLVATAEESAYSLGHLGGLVSRRGLEDATRQVATYLRRVGSRAAEHQMDLVSRQALVSLWSLGGSAHHYLPACTEVVVRELEMMESVSDPEMVDASYRSAPRSDDLEDFRQHYLKSVRQAS